MSGWGFRVQRDLGARQRLVVSVPMAALGIVDSLVCIATLGYVQPGLALDWGFKAAARSR